MRAKKSLGQHFLMHAHTAERIADVAAIGRTDTVFEIGPGTGILTRALLMRTRNVIALEADRSLYEQLNASYQKQVAAGTLKLMHGDVRTFDLAQLPRTYAVVANIPYYLTGELFRMFLSSRHQPSSMTLLIQKEVADRIVALSGKESVLSLSVKAYGTPMREFVVPRGAFTPAPNVDSAVLSVRGISRRHFKNRRQEERFFDIVRAGFAHKRKYVRRNLETADISFPDALVPEKARAEDLPLATWLSLSGTAR